MLPRFIQPNENQVFFQKSVTFFEKSVIIRKKCYNKMKGQALRYGYCYINGQCYFLIKDPLPEDEGQHSILSYTKLCDSLNANSNDQSDSANTRSIWSATIVAKTSYSEIPIVE